MHLMLLKDDEAGRRRSEDDAIAYTWRRFIEDPRDPEVVMQLPMTKVSGVVAAL